MKLALHEVMPRLLACHRRGSRLALLFDFDGTLTPLVEHPSLVRLDPHTRRLLRRLSQTQNIAVGIISGRSLADVRGLVGLPGVYYGGISGLELDLCGERVIHPRAEMFRHLVRWVFHQLCTLMKEYRGAWVEDKRLGLTLHYRQVAVSQRTELLNRAEEILRGFGDCVRVVEGALAWEITPALYWDKGAALLRILEAIGHPVLPLYAGDGINDTQALAVAANMGGVALGVGACPPGNAQYRLSDPASLVEFLTHLTESLAASEANELLCKS